MITVQIQDNHISYKHIYFVAHPDFRMAFALTMYNKCSEKSGVRGFIRQPTHTKVINLSHSEDEILAGFTKNTKYEIRRAMKEDLFFEIETDFDKYISYYKEFSDSKKMPVLRYEYLSAHRDFLVITKICKGKDILSMHSYLTDDLLGRVMLFTSSSLFRNEVDSARRSLIGRANRYLHYLDIMYLKQKGYRFYDFGGYAVDTSDDSLRKINEFKDSFGGDLIAESHYYSYPFYALKFCKTIFNRIKNLSQ